MAKKTVKKNNLGLENISRIELYLAATDGEGRKAQVVIESKGKGKTPLRVKEDDDIVSIQLQPLVGEETENDPTLKSPAAVRVRDAMGGLVSRLESLDVGRVEIDFRLSKELLAAALQGLEIALYRFRRVANGEPAKFKIILKMNGRAVDQKTLRQGAAIGQAVNLARHLTNLPPNWLNPVTYAEGLSGFFKSIGSVKIDIWDDKKLALENMRLHLAVGGGSNSPARLVCLKYRGGGAKAPVVALVGKGITFDSGGLDLKTSSGMRLMKKDMGGSAAVAGVFYWAALTRAKVNLDGYLALAENSVSSTAFRPSDVVEARSGLQVEIHNTDAEGRLVLADALDVAISSKEKLRAVIDVATLTGAIKVGLGAQIAGLFGNDAKLVAALKKAGQTSGDLLWPMPLYQKYRSSFQSNFADMINSPDGFGGAITAALFLEKFVGKSSWAHLDVYGWKDSSDGAWLESGGSGQGVQALVEFLS